jgi:hypothetical protein
MKEAEEGLYLEVKVADVHFVTCAVSLMIEISMSMDDAQLLKHLCMELCMPQD